MIWSRTYWARGCCRRRHQQMTTSRPALKTVSYYRCRHQRLSSGDKQSATPLTPSTRRLDQHSRPLHRHPSLLEKLFNKQTTK